MIDVTATNPYMEIKIGTPENRAAEDAWVLWQNAVYSHDIDTAKSLAPNLRPSIGEIVYPLGKYLHQDSPRLEMIKIVIDLLPTPASVEDRKMLSSLWEMCYTPSPLQDPMLDMFAAKLDPLDFLRYKTALAPLDRPLDFPTKEHQQQHHKNLNAALLAQFHLGTHKAGSDIDFLDKLLHRSDPSTSSIFKDNLVEFFTSERLHEMPLLMSQVSKGNLRSNLGKNVDGQTADKPKVM